MLTLYPLKFNPIYIEKIWGGNKLKTVLNKDIPNDRIGESWEISAVQDHISIVKNGKLAQNNIQELIEVFMGELVGDNIYFKYGIEFPVLVKFIDANQNLSVQVHPSDSFAKHRHYAYGKTEMWYVIDAEPGAKVVMGFKEDMSKEKLLDALESKRLVDYLNFVEVNKGDVFFIPPGRVHALGKGILIAEIEQTSDITYRLYDWDRVGLDGKPRPLHIDLAIDVIEYEAKAEYKTYYQKQLNKSVNIANSEHFIVNLLSFDQFMEMNYVALDSFVIYVCTEGKALIEYEMGKKITIEKGETVLLPATVNIVNLYPQQKTEILEVYMGSVSLSEKDIFTNLM